MLNPIRLLSIAILWYKNVISLPKLCKMNSADSELLRVIG